MAKLLFKKLCDDTKELGCNCKHTGHIILVWKMWGKNQNLCF